MALTYHRAQSAALEMKYRITLDRIASGSTILEVGCHTGYFSLELMKRGCRVRGVELDEEAAKIARGEGVSVTTGSIEDRAVLSSLSKERYDAIVMMDVLEHLVDPIATLTALNSQLEPGGKLIVTVPNVAYWAVRKDLLLGRWERVDSGILDKTHLHFHNAGGWGKLLNAAGYSNWTMSLADGFFPLERLLKRIPLFKTPLNILFGWLFRRFPTFFAVVLLFEATPDEASGSIPGKIASAR